PPRTLEQSRPGRRQLDPARRPDKQHQPKLTLQLTDRPRERRLRHVQTLRRPPEMQLLRNGDEITQLPQLNRNVHAADTDRSAEPAPARARKSPPLSHETWSLGRARDCPRRALADGAFVEPRGCNCWQSVANRP